MCVFVSLILPSAYLAGQEAAGQTAPPPLTESLDQFINGLLGSADPGSTDSLRYDPLKVKPTASSNVSRPPVATSPINRQSGVVVKLSDIALGGYEVPGFVENDAIPQTRVARNDATNRYNDDTASQRENQDEATLKSILDQAPLSDLTTEEQFRQAKIKQCLSMFFHMPVDAEKWRPWTLMHGLLPFGQQSRIQSKGKLYNAVEYVCYNAIGNDTYMMYVNNGELAMKVGPGVQGHEGQLLAMLAQANVPVEEAIRVQGQEFTVADLVEYEKQSCKPGTELTFKLIGLSHYLESEAIWRSSEGQSWNIERLIHEELKQPINGAACGGTHRLMGLSYAVNQRAERGEQVNGQWGRANHFVAQYQEHAMKYQNHDGSFSTNWFVTQESDIDMKKRLYTTGHIVEWLSFSLPQEQLNDPRLTRGVDYLLKLMLTAPALDLEIGPKGHALHALRIYERRAFGTNSNTEEITPQDLATVQRALRMQQNMQPTFDTQFGSFPAQNVSFPNGSVQGGAPVFGGGRRGFRRRN